MTSPVDICNRALSDIGAQATITSLDDPGVEGVNCKLWYDKLRTMLLRSAHWGFARAQVGLSELGNLQAGTSAYPWQYKYQYPSDCLKVRYLLYPQVLSSASSGIPLTGDSWAGEGLMPSRANRFLIASDKDGAGANRRVILSNVQQAVGVYTADIADPYMFDPLFEDALCAALSARLILPITGNAGMKSSFEQLVLAKVTSARVADGNEALPTSDSTPDWIRTRGISPYFDLGIGSLGSFYGSWDQLGWGE